MAEFEICPCISLIGQPIEIGEVVLECSEPVGILSIAPFKGQGIAVNDALRATLKIGLPAAGCVIVKTNLHAMWVGQGLWFIVGSIDLTTVSEALEAIAAVTDQSDAWEVFTLSGVDASEVMSRLCSLDLSTLQQGQTARAEFAHMAACITPVSDGFEIMVPRSYAKTAMHHMQAAMTKLAAQRAF